MRLTVADVARFPRPGTATPGRLAFSPDSRMVTFLASADGDLVRELYALDVHEGGRRKLLGLEDVGGGATDTNVSAAEALRRERERLRETGITHYQWAERAPVLLVPVRGKLFVHTRGQTRCVAEGATEARLTADGRRVVFVRDGDLYSVPAKGGRERRLTRDAAPGVTNGRAEYVAAEEMGRPDGFWISPDGAFVAFAQVDERHVPALSIPLLARGPGASEVHRYPFAGEANARVRLGVVPSTGGKVRWMDLGDPEYLCRVTWAHHAHGGGHGPPGAPPHELLVQTQPRDQRTLTLLRVDPASGSVTPVLTERSESWVNLHNDLAPLPDGTLLWSSERTGWRHLYRLNADGTVHTQLTTGEWAVDRVVSVTHGQVWFTAGAHGANEKHVYRVPVDGGEVERLTTEPGMHDAVVSPDGKAWIDVFDSRAVPPTVTLGKRAIHTPTHTPALPPPELFRFTARDGAPLHGALYRPDGPGPHPLLVAVYGGPHVQYVADAWSLTVDLRAQWLRQQGYAVLKVDNRGAARRGLAFESALYRRMGTVEVDDQVDGVRHAVAQGIADPKRVGVYGWSYGGYLSLLCLYRAPEVFRAAVAGAPVTEWEGYDTHYTERYMSTPADNPDGYRAASVLTHLTPAAGPLLLVHGLIDENVHFRHAARLLDALVKANLPHELLLFPDERHMPRSERDRAMLEGRVLAFFDEKLAK